MPSVRLMCFEEMQPWAKISNSVDFAMSFENVNTVPGKYLDSPLSICCCPPSGQAPSIILDSSWANSMKCEFSVYFLFGTKILSTVSNPIRSIWDGFHSSDPQAEELKHLPLITDRNGWEGETIFKLVRRWQLEEHRLFLDWRQFLLPAPPHSSRPQ